MIEQARQERVGRMIGRVVDRSPWSRIENRLGAVCVLLGAGLIYIAFAGGVLLGSQGTFLIGAFVAVNITPLIIVYLLRKRRKAALIDFVMPSDQSGNRVLDQEAYLVLAAEYRAIEEVDFRNQLNKAVKKMR